MSDTDRQVLEGLQAAVLLADAGDQVLFANTHAAALLGRDLTGAKLMSASFEDDSALLVDLVENYRAAAGNSGACQQLLVATQDDGSPRYFWLDVSPLKPRAAAGRRLITLTDISTPLTAFPTVRKVFSQVNHDLRSPLTSIAGAAELLLSGRVGSVEGIQRKLVTIIEEGSKKMSAILARTKRRLAEEGAAEELAMEQGEIRE